MFYVKIGGTDASTDFHRALQSIEVDLSVYMPGMATLELIDKELSWVDDTNLSAGKEIEIGLKPTSQVGEPLVQSQVVFKGAIASLEPQYHVHGHPCVLVIRAYDKLHQLHRGTGTKTFQTAKDSEIVQKIVQEAGLSGQITATAVQNEHVFRGDLSAYEFVQLLGRRNGFVTYCDGTTVHWKPLKDMNFPALALHYGDNLIEFRPVLSTSGQVDEVTVQGWDPKTKREVTGRSTSIGYRLATAGILPSGGPALAKSAFSSAKLHVSDHLTAAPVATGLAKAVFDRMASGDLTAEGTAIGNSKIKPGAKLTVSGVGSRFGGTFVITRARHTYNTYEPFRTHFWLGGMTSGTVGTLLNDDPTDVGSRSRLAQGVVVGIVTNSKDPENVGRVKVKFPWLSSDEESTWAPILGIGAGAQRGLFILPEVNDEVLVAFANGDFNQPYVLGGVWNGTDKPPAASPLDSNGSVSIRELKTRVGHILRFTDESGKEKIELIDKTAKNSLVIDSSKNSVTVSADGPISIIAKQDIKIEASAKVEIKGTADVKVSGPTVTVEASGKLALKAPAVDISGSGSVKISGPVVQIN